MPKKYHLKPKRAPDDHPRFFDGVENGDLPAGWELLLGPEEQKQAHYTAERVAKDRKRYDAIVTALGMNMSAYDISKLLHVHHRVVAAIVEREKVTIDALKNSTGELMLKASAMSVRSYLVDLLHGDVDAKTKSIAAGIFAQNGLLLTGQPTAILETRERPGLSIEAVNGFWERIKRIKGAVSEGATGAADVAASVAPAAATEAAPSASPGPAADGQSSAEEGKTP